MNALWKKVRRKGFRYGLAILVRALATACLKVVDVLPGAGGGKVHLYIR
jgi:hypothetical protein